MFLNIRFTRSLHYNYILKGSNLPALVNKIMKGQFAPVRGPYSPLFKQVSFISFNKKNSTF